MPADLRSAGNEYQDFQSAVFLFLFNDSMMQIDVYKTNLNVSRISVQADYGKKSECFSDHKLAALTFGSDILCSRIFRFAQQLVHIRQNNSLVASLQFLYSMLSVPTDMYQQR